MNLINYDYAGGEESVSCFVVFFFTFAVCSKKINHTQNQTKFRT
jgi:hypothetical protein